MARTKKSLNSVIFLDTNAILWLYAGDLDKFSTMSTTLLHDGTLLYSPMSTLEIQYLYELDKISSSPSVIFEALADEISLTPSDTPFQTVIQYAIQNTWTRDPFDRIIVAYAQAHSATLVTADKMIQKYYKRAVM